MLDRQFLSLAVKQVKDLAFTFHFILTSASFAGRIHACPRRTTTVCLARTCTPVRRSDPGERASRLDACVYFGAHLAFFSRKGLIEP